MNHANGTWVRSSYSGANSANCVEVWLAAPVTAVRDSKNPTGPVLEFPAASWRRFVSSAKRTS